MRQFVVVLLVVTLLVSMLPPPFIAYAATFIEDTQSEFDAGTHSNTDWDTDRLQLTVGSTSGTFTSQVLDGGSTNIPRFDTLAWTEGVGTNQVLGVDGSSDIWAGIGTATTWQLAKDDYNSTNGNGAVDMAIDTSESVYIVDDQDIWKSTNRGFSWTLTDTDYNDGASGSSGVNILTDSSNNVFVISGAEDVYKSTDGGTSFSSVASNFNGGTGNIHGTVSVGTSLFAVDNANDVWRSTNSGVTWDVQNTDYNGSASDGNTDEMTADNNGNLYIVDNQDIWKSTDSGTSWTKVNDDYNGSESNNATEIAGDANGNLYIADADEDIWKSTDSGVNWSKIGTNVNGGGGNFFGLVAFAVVSDITLQVRSGSTNPPTGSFIGPDGTTGTSFTAPGGEAISVTNNRYFQYRITYSSDSETYSPTLTSATVTYTLVEPITSTASSDTTWFKGGATSNNIIFTVGNDSSSSAAIQWVRFTRPSSNYTVTGDSASGWSSSASASAITFTGGSIPAGGSKAFTVTLDAASTDDPETSWSITADDQSDGSSTISVTAASGSSISTGIDATAPTTVSIASVSADSPTHVTATAASSTDSASGVHASTYWFDETSGNAGATDSTSWQGSKVYIDTGLTSDTQYCYKVKARDAVGNESAYSSASCATPSAAADILAPAAVVNLAAGSPSPTSIALTWTAPGDDGSSGVATHYDVRYSTSALTDANWSSATEATGEPTPQGAGASESFTVSNLSNSAGYYFALKTTDDNSNSSTISNIAGATTTAASSDTTPPTISSVAAGNITSSGATISWITNEAADGEIQFGSTASYGQTATHGSFITSHSITLSNLAPNATYHYRIRSQDTTSNLASTADFTFSTLAVEGGSASGGSSDNSGPIISDIIASTTYKTAIISWRTQESATARVEYGKTTSYGTSTKETQFHANDHSVFLDNLEADTEYNFRVASADLLNNSSLSSNQKFKTGKSPAPVPPPLPPAPPAPIISDVSVVAVRPTSARITWKTDIAATSRIIFGTIPKEYKSISQEFSSLETSHDRTLSDLIPGTTYYFQVVTRNERGVESNSNEGTFTTETIEIQTIIQIQKPNALAPGSPGTQTPFTVAGETTVTVPILETPGDMLAPDVTLFDFDENPTENTSPIIRGRARDSAGVIESISYSSDGGTTWHPISDVSGIGSSLATFSAKISNLRDGNYNIVFRSRDNSENVGKSNTNILIVDIKPPTTGANIILLGSQSIIPSEFGAIETLSGITQRFVTTAIGGATAVTLVAQKTNGSARADMPTLATPSSSSNEKVMGTIKVKNTGIEDIKLIPKTRFSSTNGNIYRIDHEIIIPAAVNGIPGSIEVTVVADGEGPEFNLEVGTLDVPGLKDTAYYDVLEGIVETPIKVGVVIASSDDSKQIEFPLIYSKVQDIWFGDIMLPDAGIYQTYLFAVDGAERKSVRIMNEIHVSASGLVYDQNTKLPVQGSHVTVFQYSDEVQAYQIWPGEIFNQANPQITSDTGEYRFILPPGKFYIKVEGDNYKTLYSSIFTLQEHGIVNDSFSVQKKNSYATFRIPFTSKKISFPSLPHFLSNGMHGRDNRPMNPPRAISQLIGKSAPLFSLPDATTNELIDIRYLRGKNTILSTWSTWSPHSQIQIPILDAVAKSDPNTVRVLLLSIQQSAGIVETYLRRGKYTIPSVIDTEGKLTGIYPIFSLPQHFFIDRKGIIREVHVGFLDEETVRKKLEDL